MIEPLLPHLFRPRPPQDGLLPARYEDWLHQHQDLAQSLTHHSDWSEFLAGLFEASPYLSRLIRQNTEILVKIMAQQGEDPIAEIINDAFECADRAARAESQSNLMRDLRIGKERLALGLALADCAGLWDVEATTIALSRYADASVGAAIDWLTRQAIARGDLATPLTEQCGAQSGLTVIGMGKLGALELNYSSDIDLIILFDGERAKDIYTGRKSPSEFYVRMTRDLIKIMQERTGEGYVFRTDLRLRPDASITPIALSVEAAEAYYESTGQNWERSAMIKARPIAGDTKLGQSFLDHIQPFVWRTALDFNAIAEVEAITEKIRAQQRSGPFRLSGHNVKLGRGGIREIEFFVQTQQMVAGGRDRHLRVSGTLEGLNRLAQAGHIDSPTRDALTRGYKFLRTIEHRLQMTNDEQTQTLPDNPEALERFARFLGFEDKDAFRTAYEEVLATVKSAYDLLFQSAEPALEDQDEPVDSPHLSALGYQHAQIVEQILQRWRSGQYRALKSDRSRELAHELEAPILHAFAKADEPDRALGRFDELLSRLPAGVQLFSLIRANPWLLEQLSDIMAGAPRLARMLERKPNLLDIFLDRDCDAQIETLEAAKTDLDYLIQGARDYEEILDAVRRWANDQKFLISTRLISGELNAAQAALRLSHVADAVVHGLYPAVIEEFANQHGRIEGGSFAILALGKLGERHMTMNSDIDLVFVYDAPPTSQQSDGKRGLTPSHYYARLAQRMINALSALTAQGDLYEVDMRMRPQGQKGPIATRFDGFEPYYRDKAWTYEYQAMLKARLIVSDGALGDAVMACLKDCLAQPRDAQAVLEDVAAMQKRLHDHFRRTDPFAIKHIPGGMMDLEFIAQGLSLVHAHKDPGLIGLDAEEVFDRLGADQIIQSDHAGRLVTTAKQYRYLQSVMRAALDGRFDAETAPRLLKKRMAEESGFADFDALRAGLVEAEQFVLTMFDTYIGDPGSRDQSWNEELDDALNFE